MFIRKKSKLYKIIVLIILILLAGCERKTNVNDTTMMNEVEQTTKESTNDAQVSNNQTIEKNIDDEEPVSNTNESIEIDIEYIMFGGTHFYDSMFLVGYVIDEKLHDISEFYSSKDELNSIAKEIVENNLSFSLSSANNYVEKISFNEYKVSYQSSIDLDIVELKSDEFKNLNEKETFLGYSASLSSSCLAISPMTKEPLSLDIDGDSSSDLVTISLNEVDDNVQTPYYLMEIGVVLNDELIMEPITYRLDSDELDVTSIYICDINKDSNMEILVGTMTDHIYIVAYEKDQNSQFSKVLDFYIGD